MTYRSLKIFDPTLNRFKVGSLTIENGRFSPTNDDGSDEFADLYALPGFVDVHTHGALKKDFEYASVDDVIKMSEFYASVGSLYIMATIGTVEFEQILSATDNIISAAEKIKSERMPCATIMGIHFECRYLNPTRAGAHSPHLLVDPNIDEASILLDKLDNASRRLGRRMHAHFTIAPELPGGYDFIRYVTSRCATVGIGHSDADADEASTALSVGAVSFTHTFNALRPIHHRKSTSLTTALTSDAYCEFICDGKHILPDIVRLLYHSKNEYRRVLITDSVAAGVPESEEFDFLGGHRAHIANGIAVYDDGTICGSIMTMKDCVKNFAAFTSCDAREAFCASLSNPIAMINAHDYASFECGSPANFILLDEKLRLRHVFVDGKLIASHTED